MKAAAKVVGFTVGTGGPRGVTAVENYPFSFSARKVASSYPVSARVSLEDDVKLKASQTQADVQRPCSELDDWEVAGGEEDLMVSAGETMPRVVFGGPPTLQEAKEATSELTVAIKKAYLSSPQSVGHGGSHTSDHGSTLLSNSEVLDTRHTTEKSVAAAVPTHAIQAFRFLNNSSAAQTVVASVACDPNVWNAVLQNQELQQFLQSQKTCLAFSDMNLDVKESVADYDLRNRSLQECDDRPSDSGHSEPGNGFQDIMQKIKLAVVEMMNSLSGFFQNFFRGKAANKGSMNDDETARLNSVETVLEASLMGLAIMAIMVILLKRG
ncbi:unnamed protein product [Fraxinus pennsylvanica]|uniref:Uncharacterized protein n=1 Tax=Fraxinus pennsylvanica TaxID=56036 RepID=A0AAD1YPI2_9LAMI|nr:unnamed protein product [Fraxinus pennsylvanica]